MAAVKIAEKTPNVRDRIVAAAVRLLHDEGINALTQARVSALAGVRQSHLTYYFPTRNALLQQAVFGGAASLLAVLEEPPGKHTQTLEQFRCALEQHLADRRVPRMMAGLVVASEEDPTLKPWLEQFRIDMLGHFERALKVRGLCAPRREVEVFQATIVGALHLDLAAGTAASSRRARSTLRCAFRHLLAFCTATGAVRGAKPAPRKASR